MTLNTRNRIFKAESFVTGFSLALTTAVLIWAFSSYPAAVEESAFRPVGLVQGLFIGRANPSPYVPMITTIGAVIYSFVSILIIRNSFVKTQTEEILYISFFTTSLAIECFRTWIPLNASLDLPGIYMHWSSCLLIFGRCFGLFSLFAASICASGLKQRKQRNIILVTIIVALIIAVGIPIDILAWDSSLTMYSGYSSLFWLIEIGVPVLTILNFLIAAYIQSVKDFVFIGLGCFLIHIGRDILLNSDTWFTPLPGIVLLLTGTWLTCSKLHKVYLWM